jgi:C-terminal processing protease CtpA/Prc
VLTGIHVLAGVPSFHVFTVDYVLNNSPAAREGIQIGDEIEAANHVAAAKLTLDDLDKMFKRRGTLRLQISRGGKQLKKKLKLKPMIWFFLLSGLHGIASSLA